MYAVYVVVFVRNVLGHIDKRFSLMFLSACFIKHYFLEQNFLYKLINIFLSNISDKHNVL